MSVSEVGDCGDRLAPHQLAVLARQRKDEQLALLARQKSDAAASDLVLSGALEVCKADAICPKLHEANTVVQSLKEVLPNPKQVEDDAEQKNALDNVVNELNLYKNFVVDLVNVVAVIGGKFKSIVTTYMMLHTKAERELAAAAQADGWNYATIQSDVESLREDHTKLEKQIETEKAKLMTRLDEIKGDHVVGMYDMLNGINRMPKVELELYKSQYAQLREAEDQKEDIQTNIDKLTAAKDLKEAELAVMRDRIEKSTKKKAKLEQSLETLRQGGEIQEKITIVEECISIRIEENEDASHLQKLRTELRKAEHVAAVRAREGQQTPSVSAASAQQNLSELHEMIKLKEAEEMARLKKARANVVEACAGDDQAKIDEGLQGLVTHVDQSLTDCNEHFLKLTNELKDEEDAQRTLIGEIEKTHNHLERKKSEIAHLKETCDNSDAVKKAQETRNKIKALFANFDTESLQKQLPATQNHLHHMKVDYTQFLESFSSTCQEIGRMIKQLEPQKIVSDPNQVGSEEDAWALKVQNYYFKNEGLNIEGQSDKEREAGRNPSVVSFASYCAILRHICPKVPDEDIETFATHMDFDDFCTRANMKDPKAFKESSAEALREALANAPEMQDMKAKIATAKRAKDAKELEVKEKQALIKACEDDVKLQEAGIKQAKADKVDSDDIESLKEKLDEAKDKCREEREGLPDKREEARDAESAWKMAKDDRDKALSTKYANVLTMHARVVTDLRNVLKTVVRNEGADRISSALEDNKKFFGLRMTDFCDNVARVREEFTRQPSIQASSSTLSIEELSP